MIWLILVLGLVLRVVNLDQGLWLDEGTQALLSNKSLYSIFFERSADFHPPLSYLLLHYWMMLGGSEIWLRLLSVFFGIATIAVTYQLAKKLFDQNIAIISALFLAVAPYHIYYSQEVRMYSEAAFFATLSMYFFIRVIEKNNFRFKLWYIISSLFLIYTLYPGIFLLFSQLLFVFFKQKEKLASFLKQNVLIGLFYLPWIPQLILQLKSGIGADEYLPGWGGILSLSTAKVFPLTFLKFSIGRINFENDYIYGLVAIIVVTIFGYLLFIGVRSLKKNQLLIVFWLAVPFILAFITSLKIPLNQPFRLLFLLPAFYILLATGVNNKGKFRKVALISVLLVSLGGLGAYYFNPSFWRENWRGGTKFINENCNNCSAIFVWSEPFAPFQWYKGTSGVGIVKKFPADINEINMNMKNISGRKEIYLFEYLQDLSDPGRLTQKWLDQNGYKRVDILEFNGVGFIYKYVKG